MSRPLVLFHQACADGACAAYIAQRAMPDAELAPCQYGRSPPDVRGREVYCLDFSFPRDVLLRLRAEAKSLLVLDHHKTAQAELEGLDFCKFDMEKSGARAPPTLVAYIQDRDLWRWKLPKSREANAAIRSYPLSPDSMAMLVNRIWSDLVMEGEAILRFQNELVANIAAGARETVLDGYTVLCVQSSVLQSEVGERLAEGRAFSMVFMDTKDGDRVFSLRSRGPTGIDVSSIAKAYGGGGHVSAAGFVMRRSS